MQADKRRSWSKTSISSTVWFNSRFITLPKSHCELDETITFFTPPWTAAPDPYPERTRPFSLRLQCSLNSGMGTKSLKCLPHHLEHAVRISFKTKKTTPSSFKVENKIIWGYHMGGFWNRKKPLEVFPIQSSRANAAFHRRHSELWAKTRATWHTQMPDSRLNGWHQAWNDSCFSSTCRPSHVTSAFLVETVLPDWLGTAPRAGIGTNSGTGV